MKAEINTIRDSIKQTTRVPPGPSGISQSPLSSTGYRMMRPTGSSTPASRNTKGVQFQDDFPCAVPDGSCEIEQGENEEENRNN